MPFGVQDRCMTYNLCSANCPGEAILGVRDCRVT